GFRGREHPARAGAAAVRGDPMVGTNQSGEPMMRDRNRIRVALALLVVPAVVAASGTRADAQPSHARVEGSGSSWSANAVDQWVSYEAQQGVQVGYSGIGSAIGRRDFAFRTTDFAVSDIPYQGQDPRTGQAD